MSLHALLARAEEHRFHAEHDSAECVEALAQLIQAADRRKKDAAYFKGVAVRTRGLIAYLNEGTDEQRATLHSVNPFVIDPEEVEAIFKGREIDPGPAEEDDRAEPLQPRAPAETFDDPEIAPPPAPEAPKIEPEAPKIVAEAPKPASTASLPPASSPLQDRVLAALNRARGTGPFASVDLAELRKSLGVAPSKLTGAFQALADAGRIQKVKPSKTSEPGWATYKVLDAVEQAA